MSTMSPAIGAYLTGQRQQIRDLLLETQVRPLFGFLCEEACHKEDEKTLMQEHRVAW